jgi:hypothetical protein
MSIGDLAVLAAAVLPPVATVAVAWINRKKGDGAKTSDNEN